MPSFLFVFSYIFPATYVKERGVSMELIIRLIGSAYCFGFFIAFWVIGKKYYRAMRYGSVFRRSGFGMKTLSVVTSFIMTFILSTFWMVVVCVYLGKLYLEERKW